MDALVLGNAKLLIGAALVLAGILSSVLASRFGAPLLLVFLVIGMLAGEEGLLGIAFRDLSAAYTIGSLALAVILFDGGLRTRAAALREAWAPAVLLATVGVLVTAGLTALAASPLLGLGLAESLLLGAVIASTDAAAVFFLLRAGGLHLGRRVAATLEIESGSNDPMAVFLTLFLVGILLSPEQASVPEALGFLLGQLLVGAAFGLAGGRLLVAALNRLPLPGGLHPVFAVAFAVALFALANAASGSGFLAAYLAGLVVGNRPVRAFASVLNLQDAATWLAQIVMFLVLGLLASPLSLLAHLGAALAVAAFLMLVARPAAVWLCLAPFLFAPRERLFIAWVGLRGAVGIFLASIPLLVGLPQGTLFFDVAFVVVLASLLIQGWTLRPVARALGVALPRLDPVIERVELDLPGQLALELVGYPVAPEAAILRGARLPRSARLALVVRERGGADAGAGGRDPRRRPRVLPRPARAGGPARLALRAARRPPRRRSARSSAPSSSTPPCRSPRSPATTAWRCPRSFAGGARPSSSPSASTTRPRWGTRSSCREPGSRCATWTRSG
ncbi:MAG: potassium/proton antiporter [Xanthomonadales bacterium]|nr:potassium/proton antiporter [Xanthomonadales bacterium]